jgi:hypothetical protein
VRVIFGILSIMNMYRVSSVNSAVFPSGICFRSSGIVDVFSMVIIFSIFGSFIFFHIFSSFFISVFSCLSFVVF